MTTQNDNNSVTEGLLEDIILTSLSLRSLESAEMTEILTYFWSTMVKRVAFLIVQLFAMMAS